MSFNLQEGLDLLDALEQNDVRVVNDDYSVNFDVKEKIVQLFKVFNVEKGFLGNSYVYQDCIPLREELGNFRVVPGSIIRRGSFIGDNAVIMPSFINIGSYVGARTMIDSYATVGACAYIGNNCHISSSAVIAGVLEPVSDKPVIIEDDVFVGAQCVISEGMRVGKGSVMATGVRLTASVKIIDRETKETFSYIPERSLVVPGAYTDEGLSVQCALIVKQLDQETRKKTGINQLLRDFSM